MNIKAIMYGSWITYEDEMGTEFKGVLIGTRNCYSEARVRNLGTHDIVWVPAERVIAVDK